MEYEPNFTGNTSQLNSLKTFPIDGFQVKFPFEPYECQKEIMRNILRGIKSKTHTIIESPTGTGKCLSALSSVIGFLKKQNGDSSFLEEKQKRKNILEILMLFDELNPKFEKLMKNYKLSFKKKSVKKCLDFFREFLDEEGSSSDPKYSSNGNLKIKLSTIYTKWEMMINYKDNLLRIIAEEILRIFKNFDKYTFSYKEEGSTLDLFKNKEIKNNHDNNDTNTFHTIEIEFENFLEMIETSQSKLKDQLKIMKFPHSVVYAVRTSSQIDIVYEESLKIKEKQISLKIEIEKNEKSEKIVNENGKNKTSFKIDKSGKGKTEKKTKPEKNKIKKETSEKNESINNSNIIYYNKNTLSTSEINFSYLKSRNFFCINEDMEEYKGIAKIRICNKKCKDSDCTYFKKFKKEKEIKFLFDPKLATYKDKQICPYFNEKKSAQFADILVCSYNHLFNSATRRDFMDYLVNPILILDEAHNVPSACEEYLNFKFNIKELVVIGEHVCELYKKMNENEKYKLIEIEGGQGDNNQNDSVLSVQKNMQRLLIFILILINNLIFLNQTFDYEKLLETYFPHSRRSDYNNYFIFKVFAMLIKYDHYGKEYDENFFRFQFQQENNFYNYEYYESVNQGNYGTSTTNNNFSNSFPNFDLEDQRETLKKFEHTFITFRTYQKSLYDFVQVNNKYIDIVKKIIPFIDEILNVFSLLFEVLLQNFDKVINSNISKGTNSGYKSNTASGSGINSSFDAKNNFNTRTSTGNVISSKDKNFSGKNENFPKNSTKCYIEDYFLCVNNIEFIKKEKILIDNFKFYKNFIFSNKNFFALIEKICRSHNNLNNEYTHNLDTHDYNFSIPNIFNELISFFYETKNFVMDQSKFHEKSLNLICMNPAICFHIMKYDLNPYSIIFLSGTLNPFEYYSDQMALNFSNRVENEHIINTSQVNLFVFNQSLSHGKSNNNNNDNNINNDTNCSGNNNYNFESPVEISFTKNNSDKYGNELFIESIKIINEFSKFSGYGNLVFMKTYSMLDQLVENLLKFYENFKNFKIKRINHCIEIYNSKSNLKIYKRYYLDSRAADSSVKDTIMSNYKKSCKEGTKSYMISVMRGLFSEGVNFDDQESSMIFLLGIPFPDITDDYVRLKMDYITDKHKKGECQFSGDEWYTIQAMTAFNQAVGRSIRRKNDFSTICVLESRILSGKVNKLISRWLRKMEMNCVDRYNIEMMKSKCRGFYENFIPDKNKGINIQEDIDCDGLDLDRNTTCPSIVKNSVQIKNKFLASTVKMNPVGMNTGFVTFSFK